MDESVFGTSLLVVGPEPLLIEREIAARVTAARQAVPDAELVDLGASELAEGRLPEAIGGSLFAARSIVIVRDLTALPPEQADLLVQTARHPGDDLCFVVAHPGGNTGKGLLDKVAGVVTQRVRVDPVKPWELPTYVIGEARRLGVRLDAAAAQVLVDAVGTDLAALSAAVAQLASDWAGSALDVAMVNRYFAGRAEVTGFAVADDVMRGRTDQALDRLRWALSTGVSSVLIISALAAALRNLGRYLDLRASRLAPADLARRVGVPTWKLKDLSVQARIWSSRSIAVAIQATALADAQVKGAATDPDYALERLVLALDRARRSA
ncbi:MAG: DNA polymerase III subunit delta [Actinomycetia bacterium]|nr:DNA polymerase III subunit delta [Actinomycetes bacterium]